MFFSILFKNKKGNVSKVTGSLFNIAVILNIVCLACSLLLLLGCFFVEKGKIDILIFSSIATIAGCYIIEVLLAWASAMLNKTITISETKPIKTETKLTKVETKKKKEK